MSKVYLECQAKLDGGKKVFGDAYIIIAGFSNWLLH